MNNSREDDVIIIIIAFTSILFTLLFQLILETWHYFQSNSKSQQQSVTSPLMVTKVPHSTQPILTSRPLLPKEQSPVQGTSVKISTVPSAAIGFQQEITTPQEKDELQGWYDVPTLEDIEEYTFNDTCYTPAGDEVEPDHPDSWLRILSLV
jgi:hypothetical protein